MGFAADHVAPLGIAAGGDRLADSATRAAVLGGFGKRDVAVYN